MPGFAVKPQRLYRLLTPDGTELVRGRQYLCMFIRRFLESLPDRPSCEPYRIERVAPAEGD